MYLFFTVKDSVCFCGVARMSSSFKRNLSFDYWFEEIRWQGLFHVEWLAIKDVDYSEFDNIIVEKRLMHTYNQRTKVPIHQTYDGFELHPEAACKFLRVFHESDSRDNIFDCFKTLDEREINKTRFGRDQVYKIVDKMHRHCIFERHWTKMKQNPGHSFHFPPPFKRRQMKVYYSKTLRVEDTHHAERYPKKTERRRNRPNKTLQPDTRGQIKWNPMTGFAPSQMQPLVYVQNNPFCGPFASHPFHNMINNPMIISGQLDRIGSHVASTQKKEPEPETDPRIDGRPPSDSATNGNEAQSSQNEAQSTEVESKPPKPSLAHTDMNTHTYPYTHPHSQGVDTRPLPDDTTQDRIHFDEFTGNESILHFTSTENSVNLSEVSFEYMSLPKSGSHARTPTKRYNERSFDSNFLKEGEISVHGKDSFFRK